MHALVSGFDFLFRGGFMMYPLLLSGLFALAVIFERFYVLQKRYATPDENVRKIFTALEGARVEEAQKLCQLHQDPYCSVLASGLENLKSPIVEMELAMKNQAELWMPILEKRVEILDTIITAAPLMGLLGTITGMMQSFQVLSEKGVNEPNAITGGVAEALIATATGLVIALFSLVAYNYLSNKVKGMTYGLESMSSRLVGVRMSLERTKKI